MDHGSTQTALMTHLNLRKFSSILLTAVLGLCGCSPRLFAATSLSQFGITWRFDRDYKTGQFANGDYWVVGPVTILSISPSPVEIDGETLNGSMINPGINSVQG